MINQKMSPFDQQLRSLNTTDIYDDGFLRIEHEVFHIECAKKPLKLARGEFLIVSLLARNIERFVSSEALWKHIWKGRKPYNSESLKVLIYGLRWKFEPFGIRIETMATIGYKLMPVKQNKVV
ncbi:MAG: helix-turn-helix domain-containing protein [Acidobacteriota bacterium]|nr:helix-turn-helix domain-containing protein [Acidobacteriota bacterium]